MSQKKYEDDPALGVFVNNARNQFKYLLSGKYSWLNSERIEVLNGLGFIWDMDNFRWFQNYNLFVEFKKKNQHGNIPRDYEKKALAWWVQKNRMEHKKIEDGNTSTVLTPFRQKLLEDTGFEWQINDTSQKGPSTRDWAVLFQRMRDKMQDPAQKSNFIELFTKEERKIDVSKATTKAGKRVDYDILDDADLDALWSAEDD